MGAENDDGATSAAFNDGSAPVIPGAPRALRPGGQREPADQVRGVHR
jgi:hypothetical protein